MDATTLEESAMPDSTMMDPTIEDLFGDTADGLDVALPPAPLPTTTVLRIAEMQSRGCCTRLAWSSTGSIVQISEDGTKALFRSFVRDPKTSVWTVSEPSKHPIDAPHGRKFVHAQFSGIGIDMALVDNLGTTHLYTLTGALGRMVPATGDTSRTAAVKSELDAVVGLRWLQMFPTEFKGPCFEPAVKHGDRWEFPMRTRDQKRAHHPSEGRNALLQVTRSSELTLLYQNEGQGWHSTSVELDSIKSSDELISHADIGEDGDDLLVITHDNTSKLRLYRITINWNGTQHSRAPNMTYVLVAPALEVHHLTSLDHVHAEHAEGARLTHLRLIPTPPDAVQLLPTLPMVVGVFTHAPIQAEANQTQTCFSVITRWQVETSTPTLHESFKKLRPNANTNVSKIPQLSVLKRQADTITSKGILTFDSQIFDTVLAFAATDGTVDFRDRASMVALQFSAEPNTISSLAQTGFEYISGDHSTHVAMTADGAALVTMRDDGSLHARPMTFSPGWQIHDDGISSDKTFISAAEACIARQFAFLAYTNASNDESLALLPNDVSPDVRFNVSRTIYRIMNRSPEYSMADAQRQQMFVLKDPLIPRAMSAVLALDTDYSTGDRHSRAQFAFALLNLRAVGTAVAQSLIRPGHNSTPVEVFTSLCGSIRWMTNFITFMLDTINTVRRERESKGITAREAFQQLISSTDNPVLHVLLCGFTRSLLRFVVPWTGKFFQLVQGTILPRAQTIAERQELTSLLELAREAPFRHQELDRAMSEIDSTIREAWTKSNLPSSQRAELESAMMTDGEIPTELDPAMNAITDTIFPKLAETMDMSKLYFWNIEWLGLARSQLKTGHKNWDIHRKIALPKGTPLRLCRRCGSVMEDLAPEKVREVPVWLGHAQRHCVCMNFWILM